MSVVDGNELKAVQEVILPDSVVALNVFYYEADFQEEQEDSAVASQIEQHIEGFYGDLLAQIVDDADLGDLLVYKWVYPNWTLIGERTPSGTFTSTGDMLPHGVSALIRGYTTRPTTIGRKYLPGFGEGQITAGAWNSTALTALAAAGVEWREVHDIDQYNSVVPSVWSRVTQFTYALSGTMFVPAYPGYQRRRRPGVGS